MSYFWVKRNYFDNFWVADLEMENQKVYLDLIGFKIIIKIKRCELLLFIFMAELFDQARLKDPQESNSYFGSSSNVCLNLGN